MALQPKDLVVFVGAGASVSMPSGLPMFNWLRDEVLTQLGLARYVPNPKVSSSAAGAAQGLAPEPFMAALAHAGIDVEQWLGEVLGRGKPNAVHVVLARNSAQCASRTRRSRSVSR